MDDNDQILEDCDTIVSQIHDEEDRIRLKRRWLLGCDIAEAENQALEKKSDFVEPEFLPESLLRDDDIFYETVKSRVEEAFGVSKNEICNAFQQEESTLSTKEILRELDMSLDSLTNQGLYLIAKIITRDSSSFDKTRCKLKVTIRESIKKHNRKDEIVNQIHQVLSDPRNFRKDHYMMGLVAPMFQSHRDAAMKILNELDQLSTQTLLAMIRKLKGLTIVPRLITSRCGQSRSNLISQVSLKMLSEVSSGVKLNENLAKALSLVDLSLKVSPGYKTTNVTEFFHFSTETKKLHNEIVKAVWLLDKKVRFPELKSLHLVLDPEAQVSNDSLRSAIRKMLIEYLFECSDMDNIPKSLTRALELVNKSSRNVEHKVCPREAIEEEIECILNVSAQVKQLLWKCIPLDYEIDQDFDDAYMEELIDSEDEEEDTINYFDMDLEEGAAECVVLDSADLPYKTNENFIKTCVNNVVIRDLTESRNHHSDDNDNDNDGEQKKKQALIGNKNQYLAMQDIADETSLVAHKLIGRLLEKFADQKGLDLQAEERSYLGGESRLQEDVQVSKKEEEKSNEPIIVSVVEEIIPSIEKSVLMRLKKLLEVK